jgi:ATP/maltotriose-dependent transcriptional regulator MalT
MPFAPKSAAPASTVTSATLPALERAAEGGLSIFTAPPGYILADHLATVLDERAGPRVWLSVGPEDRDPATLLLSLTAALERRAEGAGARTMELMRRQPGPIEGWPPLFACLAQTLADVLGPHGTLVLEQCHYLGDAHQTARLLGEYVLRALSESVCCVVLTERALPAAALPRRAITESGAGRPRRSSRRPAAPSPPSTSGGSSSWRTAGWRFF